MLVVVEVEHIMELVVLVVLEAAVLVVLVVVQFQHLVPKTQEVVVEQVDIQHLDLVLMVVPVSSSSLILPDK